MDYTGNPFAPLVTQAAQTYGIDPQLALRQARQESGFKQNEVSPAGAIGVMQLMPKTAEGLGVDPNDPTQNINGGMHYMRQMLDRYGGDYHLALAAYNAGPGRVDQYVHQGRPLPSETTNYVQSILGSPVPQGAQTAAAAPAASPSPNVSTSPDPDSSPGIGMLANSLQGVAPGGFSGTMGMLTGANPSYAALGATLEEPQQPPPLPPINYPIPAALRARLAQAALRMGGGMSGSPNQFTGDPNQFT